MNKLPIKCRSCINPMLMIIKGKCTKKECTKVMVKYPGNDTMPNSVKAEKRYR